MENNPYESPQEFSPRPPASAGAVARGTVAVSLWLLSGLVTTWTSLLLATGYRDMQLGTLLAAIVLVQTPAIGVGLLGVAIWTKQAWYCWPGLFLCLPYPMLMLYHAMF